jgi:ParB-like chromosome segregation protein Spo0J
VSQLLPPLSASEYEALKASIAALGIRVPVEIDADTGEVLDGHHRLQTHHELRLKDPAPTVLRRFATDEERAAYILQINLHRRHLSPEQTTAVRAQQRELAAKLRAQGKTQAEAAAILGVPRRTVDSWEDGGRNNAKHDNASPPDQRLAVPRAARPQIAARAAKGETPARIAPDFHVSERRVQQIIRDEAAREKRAAAGEPDWLRVYDVWNFAECDDHFGQKHPGRIPGQIVLNVLHYFSQPGDLVVDPMAGGGVTVDCCRELGRRCVALDIAPRREDIRKHDATKPWPKSTHGCSLVFLDPPYFDMRAAEYGPTAISALPLPDFYAALDAVFAQAAKALAEGGRLAFLVSPSAAPKHGFLDHTLAMHGRAQAAGWALVRRLSVPQSSQTLTPREVRWVKNEGRILSLVRDLLVYRRA